MATSSDAGNERKIEAQAAAMVARGDAAQMEPPLSTLSRALLNRNNGVVLDASEAKTVADLLTLLGGQTGIDFSGRKVISVMPGDAATDTRDGIDNYSYTQPFASLEGSAGVAVDGDVVVVGPGDWSAESPTFADGVLVYAMPGAILPDGLVPAGDGALNASMADPTSNESFASGGRDNWTSALLTSQKLASVATETNFVAEGDSLSASSVTGNWPSVLVGMDRGSQFTFYNVATVGERLDQVISEYASQVYPQRPTGSITQSALSLRVGANDYQGFFTTGFTGVTDWCTQLESYLTTAQTDGFGPILVWTIMQRGDLTIGYNDPREARRQTANAYIRAMCARKGWLLVDADKWWPNCTDETYFNTDHVHLNATAMAMEAGRVNEILKARKGGEGVYQSFSGSSAANTRDLIDVVSASRSAALSGSRLPAFILNQAFAKIDLTDTPTVTSQTIFAGPFTLAAWVKSNGPTGGQQWIFSGPTTGSPKNPSLFLDASGKLSGGVNFNQFNTGTTVVADGTWHHVALTWDAGGIFGLWVDGRVEQEAYFVPAFDAGIAAIGGYRAGKSVVGAIAQPVIYNRALSTRAYINGTTIYSPEIIAIMSSGPAPSDRWATGSTTATTAGSFVTGGRYRIVTVGTTSFTGIGAASNTVGVEFVATGAGTGTGTALRIGCWLALEAQGGGSYCALDRSPNRFDAWFANYSDPAGIGTINAPLEGTIRASVTADGYLLPTSAAVGGWALISTAAVITDVWMLSSSGGTAEMGVSNISTNGIVASKSLTANKWTRCVLADTGTSTGRFYVHLGTATDLTVLIKTQKP